MQYYFQKQTKKSIKTLEGKLKTSSPIKIVFYTMYIISTFFFT